MMMTHFPYDHPERAMRDRQLDEARKIIAAARKTLDDAATGFDAIGDALKELADELRHDQRAGEANMTLAQIGWRHAELVRKLDTVKELEGQRADLAGKMEALRQTVVELHDAERELREGEPR